MTSTLPGTVVVNTATVDREGTVRLLEPGFQRRERLRRTEAARICAGCPVIHRCPDVTTTAVEAVIPPRRSA